jgi:hypothetical protein
MLAVCFIMFSGLAQADSLYVRLVGLHPSDSGSFKDVAVRAGYAYVTGGGGGLHVLLLADPVHPVEVGRVRFGGAVRGVALAGDYAYVGDVYDTLFAVSDADPANPFVVGKCPTRNGDIRVAVQGQYAYVTGDDFYVISVADPAHPALVASLPGHGGIDLQVVQDYAYVADHYLGLRIISIADPAHPTQVGLFRGSPGGVALGGGLAYIGCYDSTFRLISVSDPTDPVEISRLDSVPWARGTLSVELARGYAFVATASDFEPGLHVVSLNDPMRPIEVAHYVHSEAYSLAFHGSYIYLTAYGGLHIFQFYQLGDLDIDPDSLDVVRDTLRLRRWTTSPGDSIERASGELVLANTSASYNPDTIDGPSVSPVDSLRFEGPLTGPGGSIDSITMANLPASLAPGQTVVCSVSAYVPMQLRDGDYTGSIYISGKDTAGLLVQESCFVVVSKLGDIDVDNDSLDVVADTVRVRPRLVSSGPPPEYTNYAYGQFILVNTTQSFNPDTTDGPSRSTVRSLQFSGSLSGPHGSIDSILIPNLPESLAIGQTVVCTLAVYVPPGLPQGDYSGPIVISSDSFQPQIAETVYALVSKLGDPDVDPDSLGIVHDTMDLRAQPAGPVYHPYARAAFMLVNSSTAYNPDTSDGPSGSPLQGIKVEAKVAAEDSSSLASISVLNLPSELQVGQAVQCTLALTLPAHVPASGYGGWVIVSALDTAGYTEEDSFFLRVRGPQPRENLDSLRVAPIPFKPNQNPEHDAIHFQGLSAGARVTVYDASGQSVWSATESGDGHLAWDARVASGIYVYLVVSADGKASKVGKLSVIR